MFCIAVFDPHEPADDEEHRKTFDDFKNLVDFMLGNFMEDIGITSAQFEHACFRGAKERVPLQFDQVCVHVWVLLMCEIISAISEHIRADLGC